jgi:hypothetical protein
MTKSHHSPRDPSSDVRATRRLLLLAALAAVLAGCGGDDQASSGASTLDTTAAVRGTRWGDNVTITFGDGTFRYQSDGYPNHALEAQYIMPDEHSPCLAHPTPECSHIEPVATAVQASPQDYTIPTRPQKVAETFSRPFGTMGELISGCPVYNPYEGDAKTVAMNANFTLTDAQGEEVAFMDTCNGHPSPHPMELYHYHGLPGCVTSQVDEENGPSHIIGFAFDGFPVYGDRDIDGNPVDPEGLDECNGIESPTPEFPEGVYHYVMLEVATV